MVDPDFAELIQNEVDGANSPAESLRLQTYLAGHPEARQLFDELQTLARALATVPEVEAPPSLKPHLMSSLREKLEKQEERKGIIDFLSDLLRPQGVMRLGYAFSLGVIVGLVGFVLFSNAYNLGMVDSAEVSGTMIIGESTAKFEPGERIDVKLREGNILITPMRSGKVRTVDIQVQTAINLITHMEFNPELLEVQAVKRFSSPWGNISLQEGSVSILSTGATHYTLFITRRGDTAAPVHLRVLSGSSMLLERELSL